MKLFLKLFLLLLCTNAIAQKKVYMLVGTYTDKGKSEGIYVYKFNTKNADSKYISSIKTSNPSFLSVSPDNKKLYAVYENADSTNNGGSVSSFEFNKKKGTLSFLNLQHSGGNHPCYVACDNTGKWLFAGNYTSGNFSLFPLNENGSIGMIKNNVQHFGKSINAERQQGPHVHGTFLTKDNKFLLVPDLGIDKVMIYRFNETTGELTEAKEPYIQVQAGAGPRHIAFDPLQKHVYLTEELGGNVAAFSFDEEGKMKLLQTISAVPENFKGSAGSADIHVSPDGKYLYSSNRGESNTIAIFSIDPATGILTSIGHQSTLGIMPRNFNFDPTGNFLLVANQESDNIVIFKIDHKTGLLTDTGKRIEIPSPVCIKWISE